MRANKSKHQATDSNDPEINLQAALGNTEALSEKILESDPSSSLGLAFLDDVVSGKTELDFVSAISLEKHLDYSASDLLNLAKSNEIYLKQEKSSRDPSEKKSENAKSAKVVLTDERMELEDFLGMELADMLLVAWQEGEPALQSFLENTKANLSHYVFLGRVITFKVSSLTAGLRLRRESQ